MNTITNEEFWAKATIQQNGCLEWQYAKNENGYGILNYRRKSWLAHRLAYKLVHGSVPKLLLVCHKCDNPPCINPDHLFLGTYKTNQRDSINKNRAKMIESVGEDNFNAKLTNNQVYEIRALFGHLKGVEIKRKFKVSNSAVSGIGLRQQWKHLVELTEEEYKNLRALHNI